MGEVFNGIGCVPCPRGSFHFSTDLILTTILILFFL